MPWLIVLASIVAVACSATPGTATASSPTDPRVGATVAPPTTSAPAPVKGPPPTLAPLQGTTPAASLDPRTRSLIAQLDDWCASRPPSSAVRRLMDLLAQLADGRSAYELVGVVGRSSCQLPARAYGDGPTEIVTASVYRDAGALLWVDHGFWRIAPVPTYSGSLTLYSDRTIAGRRELLFGLTSGGTAGDRGVLAVELAGGSATVTLDTVRAGADHVGASRINDELLVVGGRKLPNRPWGITSNCCLPGGHQWLWRWTPFGYVLIAERQAQDSYYALNALLGAIDAGKPTLADDVATRTVVDSATALFGPVAPNSGLLWTYKGTANQFEQDQAERFRWTALGSTGTRPTEPVRYEISRYNGTRSAATGPSVVITFERIGEVWMATALRRGTLP